MTSRDFAYWLQGFFELNPENTPSLSAQQVDQIKKHLNMVFIHEIDPSFPAAQQQELNDAHQKNDGFAHMGKKLENGAIARC